MNGFGFIFAIVIILGLIYLLTTIDSWANSSKKTREVTVGKHTVRGKRNHPELEHLTHYVYIIKMIDRNSGESAYKIGMSVHKDVLGRRYMDELLDYIYYKLVSLEEVSSRSLAYDIEEYLLNKFKSHRYTKSKRWFVFTQNMEVFTSIA